MTKTRLVEQLLARWAVTHPLRSAPKVEWSRRMTRAAGCAYPAKQLIRLSARLLTDERRIEDTLAHEYAHLLAHERHGPGIRPHGPEWRAALRSMGYDPKRCHDYPEAATLGARLVYACERCGFSFRRRRRLPLRRTYVHRRCGGRIVLLRRDAP